MKNQRGVHLRHLNKPQVVWAPSAMTAEIYLSNDEISEGRVLATEPGRFYTTKPYSFSVTSA